MRGHIGREGRDDDGRPDDDGLEHGGTPEEAIGPADDAGALGGMENRGPRLAEGRDGPNPGLGTVGRPVAPIEVRLGAPGDVAFVFSTWLWSYRRNSDFARAMHWKVFMHYHRKVLERITSRPSCRLLVAHQPGNRDIIYGYMVVESGIADRDVVHYIFVKEAWRRFGIATSLILASGIDPKHSSIIVQSSVPAHAELAWMLTCVTPVGWLSRVTHLTKDSVDRNPASKYHGTFRWRGADTLLRKYPLAKTMRDPANASKTLYIEGNLYCPYLI